MKHLAVFVLFVFLVGCSTAQPSLMSVVNAPPPSTATANWSDDAIVRYWASTHEFYGGRNDLNVTGSYAGAITILAIGVAAFQAKAPGTKNVLMAVGAAIAGVLGIVQPDAKAGIYTQGQGLLTDALGEYFVAATEAGYCTVPIKQVSPQGAILLQKTMAAQKVTQSMLTDLIPRQEDFKTLAKDQTQVMRRGVQGQVDGGCK